VSELLHVRDWRERAVYTEDGPKPSVLYEDSKVKVILGALMPGARIPEHPEALAMYHFLDGEGTMVVDGQEQQVVSGTTVMVSSGSTRGISASTKLAFLATRIA